MLRTALALAAGALLVPAGAQAAERYTRCPDVPGTLVVDVSDVPCEDGTALAGAVLAAPEGGQAAAAEAAGFTPYRAQQAGEAYDLVALRGRGAVRLRLPGEAPDVDLMAAGRELLFARGAIVGGRPVPSGASTCTSAFPVVLRGGRRAVAGAAHCAGLRSDRTVHRRNVAVRRPPAPGIVLGRVLRILTRTAPLDALVAPAPRGVAPVVDRGFSAPPRPVVGGARLTSGRRICFTGRTSGVDRCGRLRGDGLLRAERLLTLRTGLVVRCTTAFARPGDSGGPVYTAPDSRGRVRALGIVTLVVGGRRGGAMCFTPLAPSLDRLGARLLVL